MPSHWTGNSPGHFRRRERVRREQTRILVAKGLTPGCGKFSAVLARRMKLRSSWAGVR